MPGASMDSARVPHRSDQWWKHGLSAHRSPLRAAFGKGR
jgi:hypothetical protein